jgi:hypothetical protein
VRCGHDRKLQADQLIAGRADIGILLGGISGANRQPVVPVVPWGGR